MTGTTHFIGGLTLFGLYCNMQAEISTTNITIGLILAGVGSLMPDIDLPGSTISQLLLPISKAYNWLEDKLCKVKHRGLTHSIFPVAILLLIYFLTHNNPYVSYFAIGYTSHILLDMMNKGGVPIFYPVSRRRFRIGAIRTGTVGESVVCVVLYVLFVVEIYWRWV